MNLLLNAPIFDEVSSLLSRLQKFSSRRPNILLGYLFGSKARGTDNFQSDFDIAFLLKERPTFDDRLELISALMKELRTNGVDVILLNQASPLLRYEAVSGNLFFERDAQTTNDFEMRVFREYFDTEHLRKVQNQYLNEAILQGKP